MILGVPTPDDFSHAGTAYLNLAWDTVLQLSFELEGIEEWDLDGTVADDYWNAAQRPLATATTLVQQGTEFLLKSRIARVSPYLLLDGSPRDWPRGSHLRDTPFSSFKTIDAQELIRAHDTVHAARLPTSFITLYEHFRQTRNTVMHTVDTNLRFTVTDVIISILETSHTLFGTVMWTQVRKQFMESDHTSVVHSPDHVEPLLAKECLAVIGLLNSSQIRRFFNFNTRQRRYLCPYCSYSARDWELHVDTAQLRPNTKDSTALECFVCRHLARVERRRCTADGCQGNVIDAEDGTCLTCWDGGGSWRRPSYFEDVTE